MPNKIAIGNHWQMCKGWPVMLRAGESMYAVGSHAAVRAYQSQGVISGDLLITPDYEAAKRLYEDLNLSRCRADFINPVPHIAVWERVTGRKAG